MGLCGKAGIVDVGVAVDGTKLGAAASDGAIRSYEQIPAEIVAEAGRIDAAEDEIHGDARGDELPKPTLAIGLTSTSTRCASAASSRSSPPTPPGAGHARPGSAGPMTSCAG
jgi:hypothetical protein